MNKQLTIAAREARIVNLQQLYYFKTAAELEHYTMAANKLMISQSSLSHAISDLEKELGVLLFEPSGRNVRLTKYGTLFLEYVTQSLDILDEGRARLHDFISPETGIIAIAYMSSLDELIPYIVSRYYADTGRIQTTFQFYQVPTKLIEAGIISGSYDIAFATGTVNSQVNTNHIGTHETVLIVSKEHPLAKKEAVYLAEIKNEKIICYDHQCQIRYYLDEIFKEAGIAPNIILETTHDSVIIGSVAMNLGVGFIPKPLGNLSSNVKKLRILDPIPPREIMLIWKKSRYISPVIKIFRNYILENDGIIREFFQK